MTSPDTMLNSFERRQLAKLIDAMMTQERERGLPIGSYVYVTDPYPVSRFSCEMFNAAMKREQRNQAAPSKKRWWKR